MKTKDIRKRTKKLKKQVEKGLEGAIEAGSENKGKTIAAAGIATAGIVGVGIAAARARKKDRVATYHVMPGSEGGWSITREGSDEPLGLYPRKRSALAEARTTANEARPSALVIHGKDGEVQKTHTYDSGT